MPLFRDRRERDRRDPPLTETPPLDEELLAPAPPPPPPPGPHLIHDGPVLASWFVLYRLAQELERARRYTCPLSIIVAQPQLIGGEQPSAESREAAARAASTSARSMDVVGWLDEQSIIVVLVHTNAPSARFAATRLRDEMWLFSYTHGGQKWNVSLVDDLDEMQALIDQQSLQQAA